MVFANSQGFAGEYAGTTYSLAVAPIAEENGAMQPGHWYTQIATSTASRTPPPWD